MQLSMPSNLYNPLSRLCTRRCSKVYSYDTVTLGSLELLQSLLSPASSLLDRDLVILAV